jgi:hypothetical protein
MILKKFGLYLLQKRYNAVWVVLLCAFLPFVQIPTASIAILIVGLVTLHQGAKEGFFLLCWMALPAIAATFFGDFGTLLIESVGKGLVVWVMACVLAATVSWTVVVQATVACGVVLVAVAHLLVPDIQAWWLLQLSPYAAQVQASWNLNLSPDQVKLMIERASHFATGVVVAGILALDVVLLLMARSWQATLFNPGGLAKEWRQLRLNYLYSAMVIAVSSSIWLGATWLFDVLPIVLMPFIFAGLSLIHAKLPEQKNIRLPVLIALYTSLLLFAPYVCMMLFGLAFTDSLCDFRAVRKK